MKRRKSKPTWEESNARREELRAMLRKGPVRICEVVEAFEVSRPTAIADLEKVGARRDGYAPHTSWALP
jgi:hypothetical protein